MFFDSVYRGVQWDRIGKLSPMQRSFRKNNLPYRIIDIIEK